MLFYEIPQEPWKFLSQDLFKQGGLWCALEVNHYNDLIEVDLLYEDITTEHAISHCAHFTRYGIPVKFLTAKVPHYISKESLYAGAETSCGAAHSLLFRYPADE